MLTLKECSLKLTPYFANIDFSEPKLKEIDDSHKKVYFTSTLPISSNSSKLSSWISDLWCKIRSEEVTNHFDCMIYLLPPLPSWDTTKRIVDYNNNLQNPSLIYKHLFGEYCVYEGKAMVIYERPARPINHYADILKDLCDGYSYVFGYNRLKLKEEYKGRTIPYDDIKSEYKKVCSQTDDQTAPTFCSSEYRIDSGVNCKHFKLDCVHNLYWQAISERECKSSEQPLYKAIFDANYYDLAKLNEMSYYNDIAKKSTLSNWKFLKNHVASNVGFYGDAFLNQNLEVIAIVFRGTDDLSKDWIFSNICFNPFIGCKPMQYRYAEEFYQIISHEYSKQYKMLVTGHSLGGALAQLIALDKGIEAVSYDSPGTLGSAASICSDDKIQSNKDKITSFISGFNLVNIASKHVVDPIQVNDKYSVDCEKFFLIGSTLSQHDISKISSFFNKGNGKPFIEKILNKDDLTALFAYNKYQKDCVSENYQEIISIISNIDKSNNDIYLNKAKINFLKEGVIQITKNLPFFHLPSLFSKNNIKEEHFPSTNVENIDKYFSHIKSTIIDDIKHDLGLHIQFVHSWEIKPQDDYNNFYQIDIHSLTLENEEKISKDDYNFYCKTVIGRKEVLESKGYEMDYTQCAASVEQQSFDDIKGEL